MDSVWLFHLALESKPSVIINAEFGVVFGLSCRDPEIIGNLCRVVSLRPK